MTERSPTAGRHGRSGGGGRGEEAFAGRASKAVGDCAGLPRHVGLFRAQPEVIRANDIMVTISRTQSEVIKANMLNV